MMCIAGLPFHGYVAMGPMAVNQVTPNQMRAQVSAVYLFTVNLLGLGFGPALVPIISDYILRDPMQIRWGLLIVVVTAPARSRRSCCGSYARVSQKVATGHGGRSVRRNGCSEQWAHVAAALLRPVSSPGAARIRRWKHCP